MFLSFMLGLGVTVFGSMIIGMIFCSGSFGIADAVFMVLWLVFECYFAAHMYHKL